MKITLTLHIEADYAYPGKPDRNVLAHNILDKARDGLPDFQDVYLWVDYRSNNEQKRMYYKDRKPEEDQPAPS